ncbi:DUF1093 domain-containing protein [Lysinibacillus agricola]|uniref:DUF1093 domain-containing protein n=1 Tax=Lysinibacillus agricola TaxID=2590012 RepID=A0ABX7AXU4_9BACI|nr:MULTISPECIES: DUF1093 domain-containing protein [Lysinibacillus]KOS60337.1 hypothetical protein AN161_24995 [Lysinibacillus sp. FJAT-14222]QQP14636.1 DUF1093 domain-containing protein [Lysinibacillus agricola]
MKKMKFITITLLFTILLVGCGEKGALIEKDFYVQINEEAQTPEGNSNYVYVVDGYDKDGNEKVITFFVEKPFEKGTIIRVPRSLEGYTGDPEVMNVDELPNNIKEKFNQS